MDWFRHYHGLCIDKKLHKISRAAGVRRYVVIAAWCAILEDASQSSSRGDVSDIDPSTLAYTIDAPEHVCARVLTAIIEAGMIVNGRVSAWDKRQRISDDAAIRQQQTRMRREKGNGANYGNSLESLETTPPMSRDSHATNPSRTEQIRTENIDSIKPPYNSPHEIAAVAACANEEQTSFVEPPPMVKPSRAERVKATEQEFEAFWSEVPKGRRTGKIACQRKFATLVASGKATGEQIRGRMHEYAELCREKATPLGSIKHPETWLNKGCWADEEQVVPTLDGLVPAHTGNQMSNAYQRDQRPPGVRPGRITNAILEYSKMTGYDIRNLRI